MSAHAALGVLIVAGWVTYSAAAMELLRRVIRREDERRARG